MGDRATLLVTDSGGTQPICGIYLHWHASDVPRLLPLAFKRMRGGDVGYSTARLIGVLHEEILGNLSLGVQPPPPDSDEAPWSSDAVLQAYSPGDGGVVVINCSTGEVRCTGGYLGREWHPPGVSDLVHGVTKAHGMAPSGPWTDWHWLGEIGPDSSSVK